MSDPFVVRVPKTNWAGSAQDMRSRLQTWEWHWDAPARCGKLVIDFSEVQFLEPWALAMFVAYGLRVRAEHSIPVETVVDHYNPSNSYLEDMGLSHVVATGTSIAKWDDSDQNTGLHVIRTYPDVQRFVESAVRLGLGPSNETMDALRYCMIELGRNVVQHADALAGGVAIAQYFPDRQAIQVVMADAGRGVRSALQFAYPEIRTHGEAVKLAILPHVSGAVVRTAYSAGVNAGLGLFFTKEIAWRADGSFWLVSGDSLIGVRRRDDEVRERVYRRVNPWPGTLVAIDIPSRGVHEFGGLLALCNELAAQARQSTGRAGVDFVDEELSLDGVTRIDVAAFAEDVERARHVRDDILLPRLKAGDLVLLDFAGTRFVTQSFAHALLSEAFKIPGALFRMTFLRCSKSSEESIRAVAAYSAQYRCID